MTVNDADKILMQSTGSRRSYKRLEVEELHRFIIHLVNIELNTLSDDFYFKTNNNENN